MKSGVGTKRAREDAVKLEELTRIAGITFISVYLAISGRAIIKMSAALTYRLAAAMVQGVFRKKKKARISDCETRFREKKSPARSLFDRVSPFTEFRPISSALTTLPRQSREEKGLGGRKADARSMER